MTPSAGTRLAACGVLAAVALADMHDVLLPHYLPPAECAAGCAAWASVGSAADVLWAAGAPPPHASNFCAIPAAAVDEPKRGATTPSMCGGPHLGDLVCNGSTSSFYGPICACAPGAPGAAAPTFATCTASRSYPEQINLQIAAADTVVVSFVTFEEELPAEPPALQLRDAGETTWQAAHTGVAHRYTTSHAVNSQFCSESLPSSILCLRRNYTLSFVKLTGLKPRHSYEYRVKSGGADFI